MAQLVKKRLQCRRPQFDSWIGKTHWRRDGLPTPELLGFPCGSAGKESACSVGDLGLIPGMGRSPGEGKGYPLRPGELHGLYSPWGHKELDMTEQFSLSLSPWLMYTDYLIAQQEMFECMFSVTVVYYISYIWKLIFRPKSIWYTPSIFHNFLFIC